MHVQPVLFVVCQRSGGGWRNAVISQSRLYALVRHAFQIIEALFIAKNIRFVLGYGFREHDTNAKKKLKLAHNLWLIFWVILWNGRFHQKRLNLIKQSFRLFILAIAVIHA